MSSPNTLKHFADIFGLTDEEYQQSRRELETMDLPITVTSGDEQQEDAVTLTDQPGTLVEN